MGEMEAEFERNINEIKMDTSLQSPIQNKYMSTINDSVYNESYTQVDKIIDSNKQVDTSGRLRIDSIEQVDTSSDPRVDTHITDGIQKMINQKNHF